MEAAVSSNGIRKLRMPPRIKVLEAAGALGDRRVSVESGCFGGLIGGSVRAAVIGSDGSRRYMVIISPRGRRVIDAYSNDNGTSKRGYIGYPLIAVMMLCGLLPRDRAVERALSGIPWRELNEKYKKYSMVEEVVLKEASKVLDPSYIEDFRRRVLEELGKYRIYYNPSVAGAGSTP